MVEKDHTQEQTIEYNPAAYVSREDAIEAGKMLHNYLKGNKFRTEAQLVGAINNIISARHSDLDGGDSMYGARVTYVDDDGEAYTGVVLEPHVTEMQAERAWDPYEEEYVDPSEYPLGTVQLVYTPDGVLGEDVFFDRMSDLEAKTSVMPATEPGGVHCYYPGWDYARDSSSSSDSGQ